MSEEQVVVENEEKKFSWKRLLITTSLVILTAVLTFGITWFILDKSVKESDEASNQLRIELQRQIDELRTKLKTDTTKTEASDLTYKNTDYGFQMTFPETWKEYKFLEKTIEGATKTWYVELPTNDPAWAVGTSTNDAGYVSLFAISALTDAQWQAMDSGEMNTNTLIEKVGNYNFTYSHAQAGATDIGTTVSGLVKSIITTFKVS